MRDFFRKQIKYLNLKCLTIKSWLLTIMVHGQFVPYYTCNLTTEMPAHIHHLRMHWASFRGGPCEPSPLPSKVTWIWMKYICICCNNGFRKIRATTVLGFNWYNTNYKTVNEFKIYYLWSRITGHSPFKFKLTSICMTNVKCHDKCHIQSAFLAILEDLKF
jgi:hypothetical protein